MLDAPWSCHNPIDPPSTALTADQREISASGRLAVNHVMTSRRALVPDVTALKCSVGLHVVRGGRLSHSDRTPVAGVGVTVDSESARRTDGQTDGQRQQQGNDDDHNNNDESSRT